MPIKNLNSKKTQYRLTWQEICRPALNDKWRHGRWLMPPGKKQRQRSRLRTQDDAPSPLRRTSSSKRTGINLQQNLNTDTDKRIRLWLGLSLTLDYMAPHSIMQRALINIWEISPQFSKKTSTEDDQSNNFCSSLNSVWINLILTGHKHSP